VDGSTPPPDGFGSAEVRWRPSAVHDPIDVASLYLRHRVMAAVRTAWPDVYPRDEFAGRVLAAKMGEKERPWQKRVAGTQTLSLADLVTLAALFGDGVLAALPRGTEDLFPPEYAPNLRQWCAGEGRKPVFVDSEPDSVDWQPMIAALARFDSDELLAGRSHLISADTYRYFFASVYGGMGGHVDQLELVTTELEGCEAMVLHAVRRVAILFADLRDPIPRSEAAKSLVRVIHQTSIFDAHEKVVVIVVGPSAASQVRVLFPMAYAEPGESFRLDLERTELMGPEVAAEVMSLENNEITLVGRSARQPDGQILALRIDK
jgi:hypothetical protein